MGTFDSTGAFMPMKVRLVHSVSVWYRQTSRSVRKTLQFLILQKGGKETILEEELEFKGIEEEEEETHVLERSSAEGDKDKGEQSDDFF